MIMPIWNFIKNVIDTIVSYVGFGISIIKGLFTTLTGFLLAPFQTLQEMVAGVFMRNKNHNTRCFNCF